MDKQSNISKEKEKKANKRLIIIIILCVSFVIDLVIFFAFLPKITKSNQKSDNPYVMDETISEVYDNIIKFSNDALEELGTPYQASSIIALEYEENSLKLALNDENKAFFFNIPMDIEDVDTAINVFRNNELSIDDYQINTTIEDIDTTTPIDSNKYQVNMVSRSLDSSLFLSFTTLNSDNTISTLVKGDFAYPQGIKTINYLDNKTYFDICYYILSK